MSVFLVVINAAVALLNVNISVRYFKMGETKLALIHVVTAVFAGLTAIAVSVSS